MINLLHFAPAESAGERRRQRRHRARGSGTAGVHAYRDYSDQVVKMVEARGGKVIWTGRPEHVLIGDTEADDWDLVALVSYPSRAAFIDMVTSPSYEEAHDRPRARPRPHRAAGLRAPARCAAPPERERGRRCLRSPGAPRPPPQHPLHHDRPAALRQPRLQRRHGGPHAGRRPAGRRGHQLPARLQPEHRVHAGPLHHAHRPVRAHPRRRGQRHPAPGRRAVHRPVPARQGRLPHRPARQGPLRARLRPPAPVRGERPRGPAATPGPGAASSAREQAMHAAAWGDHPIAHYGRWLKEHHPEHLHSFAGLLQAEPGGDTGAPETKNNPIPREWYHTDWVADLTVDWLNSLARRRAVVLLDVVPRPAPPVGPAGLRAAPGALAGPRPAARPSRLRRRDPRGPGAQARPLARLLGGPVLQHGGRPGGLRPLHG